MLEKYQEQPPGDHPGFPQVSPSPAQGVGSWGGNTRRGTG